MEGLHQAVAKITSGDSGQQLLGLQHMERLITESHDQVVDELSNNAGIVPFIVNLMGNDNHPVSRCRFITVM